MRLVLASRSPRRADLLRAAGFDFVVRPGSVDESVRPGEAPEGYVARLAREKAFAVPREHHDEVVLAADTVVLLDGRLLGKPAGQEEAAAMLQQLSGRIHEVLTGVCVRAGRRSKTVVERTAVTFAALAPDEIAWYVASGEPHDKAGAYGIQGRASRFVERIDGSYTNVVGLPVAAVRRLLASVASVPG